MTLENISIGIDIEENSRFRGKDKEKDKSFLSRIFTDSELEYCYGYSEPAGHLCARYCAKEAVVKALSGLGVCDVYYKDIEIFKNKNNVPKIGLEKYPDIEFKLSISHSREYSVANVIAAKGK